jgi:lipopolysaccharide/colanic/teichoic acid biosynthesis glycosyltransferase
MALGFLWVGRIMSTIHSDLDFLATTEFALDWAEHRQLTLQRAMKRGLDIVLASLAILVLALPMLLIALTIIVDSRGAPMIRQRRVKARGQLFDMLKFRSMVEGAELKMEDLEDDNVHDGPIFKIPEDPRRTRVGRILRKTSLDELPNLFNVLTGDMSLVGPRPPMPREVVQYDSLQMRRLAVRPGMTGLWQISGRSLLPFDEMVRLDLNYIERWSFWRDVVILVRTLPAVISGRGAY